MEAFVDTSALFVMLDGDDADHDKAGRAFESLAADGQMITHNYVLTEALALTHRRLGVAAVRDLQARLVPILSVVWVNDDLHAASMSGYLATASRRSSFVDAVSFETMRRKGLDHAFAFDSDFAKQGFTLIPG